MKPQIIAVLSSLAIVGMLFAFASCGNFEDEIKVARSDAYEAGYQQGMEDSGNLYSEEDLEDAYWEGFENGASEMLDLTGGSNYDYGSSNADVDDVLSQAASFAYRETGRDVYEAWNDIMIHIDNSGARNDLAKNAETLMYYCMFLDEYGFYYESDFTDIFEE